jgi:hypothetical protein
MTQDSITPTERARKGISLVLQHLQPAGKAGAIAAAMGVSDSTISRIKTERLDEVVLLLAHLGLKIVPTTYRCVDAETYHFLTRTHERVMHRAPELIWDSEE